MVGRILVSAGVVMLAAQFVAAGELALKGVHLCCGACVRDVGKALDGVEGVSQLACDRDAMMVSMQVSDRGAAGRAIKALAAAGFAGKPEMDGKSLDFPVGVNKGVKADKVVLKDVHLCCGGCVRAAVEAAKKASGVTEVAADRDASTLTVSGSSVEIAGVITELHKAGFHGSYRAAK